MIQEVAPRSESVDGLLYECATTLRKVASYKMPPSLDRRLLWLSENK